jgi:hypothetical protein
MKSREPDGPAAEYFKIDTLAPLANDTAHEAEGNDPIPNTDSPVFETLAFPDTAIGQDGPNK